ncbi:MULTISPECIES: DUF2934 domain-containing protein [Caballeronia]|jgi:hypothetical protein|uniref:DUF2934 domain-containing protein n=1 Tax=Caballeronia zhejiangensis TaxID=871203 RepID=A0A656QAI0_9BURK|nr:MULTISPECIES: DUF2934 domain-containing protein [Caballeronia]EKS71764.1 hypothetical protein BURK_007986 [Burkholderia sp. SJ98]KDR24823.1 hypothetical protein BG60_33795 [Caballeronia zhejiangensis]
MNVPFSEEQVRALAYQLWEEAGSPEGQSEKFWGLARKQLEGTSDSLESGADAMSTESKGSTPTMPEE